MSDYFLPPGGGYRKLKAYQIAEAICDLTSLFVKKYVPRNSRTCDQMEQAARSGKQNIAEGSVASPTSKETEIKLTNVAKASLEELVLDYEDYLRQHSLAKWEAEHPRIQALRAYLKSERFLANPMEYANRYSAEEFCNAMITLISQCKYLLRRLIAKQQEQFINEGGIREKMYKVRTEHRAHSKK